ncbi:hypothetical protein [Acidithiobacillus ferriphilus]|jgi:hypothetical protein|uniref:hypothetical protein n=1 Tax=Acidithiobacillus ferriphilus TaxID=1689834 RepID=UPI001C073AC6|nr:hypothetical protein [Acidithiobacillus ferriphilus]MBU2829980.1 hypothetical protein [Acidithiobacillus ferriphilus]MBW9248189.1 hypothetical protein [Acidithiobacillus ferriphilus]MBW9254273.1 hypothetical protein [Acidithiobacillus ferriphilus]
MAGNDVKKLEKMKDDLEAKAIERRRARICRAMEGAVVCVSADGFRRSAPPSTIKQTVKNYGASVIRASL